ncbi:MAG: helix-turn-helix domain-containing protein, partial [Patescibacteria group bacterium]|nr:helix-turn-helix domain-containing protein [Patescibacteria group bacterium]
MKSLGDQAEIERERDLTRGAFLFRVTEDILVAMEDCGVTKAELANRLGKSKARISQLLSGDTNMTIGTLSDIAFALGLTPDKTFKEYSERRQRMGAAADSSPDHHPDR